MISVGRRGFEAFLMLLGCLQGAMLVWASDGAVGGPAIGIMKGKLVESD